MGPRHSRTNFKILVLEFGHVALPTAPKSRQKMNSFGFHNGLKFDQLNPWDNRLW